MNNKIIIAVDAMGGENSPKKVLDGIAHFSKNKKDIFFNIFGDSNTIKSKIPKSISKSIYKIIHTDEFVKDEDSAFVGAKNGGSFWQLGRGIKYIRPAAQRRAQLNASLIASLRARACSYDACCASLSRAAVSSSSRFLSASASGAGSSTSSRHIGQFLLA